MIVEELKKKLRAEILPPSHTRPKHPDTQDFCLDLLLKITEMEAK